MSREVIVKCIADLLEEVYLSQMDKITQGASLVKETLNSNHKVYFFGQGHSVWVGEDIVGSYSEKVVAMHECYDSVQDIYHAYQIKENDLVILVSNSGINAKVIDFAILLKKKGHKIIVINSNKHTMYTKSRHESKMKLYQFADVAIDNCCKYSDVGFTEDEDELASLSSIINNTIAHCIMQEAFKED